MLAMETVDERELANKYRVSWYGTTEIQRQAVCIRFGIEYTHAHDESILRQVAKRQQALYLRSKQNREEQLIRTAKELSPQAKIINSLKRPVRPVRPTMLK